MPAGFKRYSVPKQIFLYIYAVITENKFCHIYLLEIELNVYCPNLS